MIRLLTGATRISGRVYRPESGAFEADKQTEEYLVKRGVAVYVGKSDIGVLAEQEEAAPVIEAEAPEDAPVIEAEAPTVEAKKPAAKRGGKK